LAKAVLNRDYETAFKLLDSGENVNTREREDFKTLSHIICKRGDIDTFKRLMKYEPDLEALDFEFMTPLFEAVMSDNIELLEYMLEELKVNIHHKEIQNRTAFYWAACNGELKIIDYLLSKNVDVNIHSSMGRTPISKAVWNGRVDIVQRLLQVPGIDFNQRDQNMRAPIHNAVWGANGGRLGKKVSGVGTGDSPECVQLLIEAGAELEVEDKEGYTPLMIASSTGGTESLKLLINVGCNPHHLNKEQANCLIEATRYNNTECIKIILDKVNDLDINIKDAHDMSAVDYAVAFDHPHNLKLFIEYKNLSDDELLGILNICIYSNSLECFKLIIDLFNKNEFFIRNSYHIFTEIIEKVLNLSLYDIFNMLVDEYKNYIEIVFFQDIQYICKLLLLSEKYIHEKEEDLKNEEKDDDLVIKEISKDSCDKFLENCKKLFELFVFRILEKKQISETFLKTLIYLNKIDEIKEIISKCEDFIFVEDKILINLENYKKFKISQKRKKTRNVFYQWKDILNTINCNNAISLALSKPDEIYFDFILSIKHFHKNLFEKLSDNKNLLHLLFANQNLARFKKALNFVEEHFTNKIDLIIHMLDEHDDDLLTPLDILIKHKFFEMVQVYTDFINQLRIKHKIELHHKKDIFYKVCEFLAKEDVELKTPTEFFDFIEEEISTCKNEMVKEIKSLESNEMFKAFGKDLKFIEKTSNIVKLINSDLIEKEFKINNSEYKHLWVDSEENLKLCSEFLEKYNYIGVDMEYHGDDVRFI
jgi:ankyrin repeat protein